MFRDITVQQRQTRCYWDNYREADPRIREQTNPACLSHQELYCKNNPALVPTGGDCILSHHPSPLTAGFFPPCSRNSSPRIDRVLRDTCLEHQAEVQPLGYAILPEKEGSPSKHRSTRRSKAHLPPCQPTFSFLSKKYVTGRAAFKSVHPFQNTGRMCCPACQR